MIDVGSKEQLERYIEKCGLIQAGERVSIHYFSGGVSGVTALVRLQSGRELVVKQAYAELKVAEKWECDPERIEVEYDALTLYNKTVPDYVTAPVSFDRKNEIMIREAVSEDWSMWKSDLLQGRFNYCVAEKVADALAKIHNSTAGLPAAELRFNDSRFFDLLRVKPYIEHLTGKYPQLKERADALSSFLLSSGIALIHGDYSPKNILVRGDEICILDLEVAYYGHPCFDLAFLTNHFLLKAVNNKRLAEVYLHMLAYMVEVYLSLETFMERRELEAAAVRTLAFLFLARVDGKSPVEYLKSDDKKNTVRAAAMEMIEKDITNYRQAADCLRRILDKEELKR